jgi:hypothetical protein
MRQLVKYLMTQPLSGKQLYLLERHHRPAYWIDFSTFSSANNCWFSTVSQIALGFVTEIACSGSPFHNCGRIAAPTLVIV